MATEKSKQNIELHTKLEKPKRKFELFAYRVVNSLKKKIQLGPTNEAYEFFECKRLDRKLKDRI